MASRHASGLFFFHILAIFVLTTFGFREKASGSSLDKHDIAHGLGESALEMPMFSGMKAFRNVSRKARHAQASLVDMFRDVVGKGQYVRDDTPWYHSVRCLFGKVLPLELGDAMGLKSRYYKCCCTGREYQTCERFKRDDRRTCENHLPGSIQRRTGFCWGHSRCWTSDRPEFHPPIQFNTAWSTLGLTHYRGNLNTNKVPPNRETYGCENRTLFHITQSGQEIFESGMMMKGKKGMVGAGIYFAATVEACQKKALSSGYLIRANVLLGKALLLDNWQAVSRGRYYGLNFELLQWMGYDSVVVTGRKTGDEYVVYNSDQVEILSIESFTYTAALAKATSDAITATGSAIAAVTEGFVGLGNYFGCTE